VPLVPILGIVTCLLLMFSLPSENWLRLAVWLVIGLTLYFGYGRRNSRLNGAAKASRSEPASASPPRA
jgi:APA family basic amino acid/polyamine antiporter